MTAWRMLLALGGLAVLQGCAPHLNVLVPGDASAGQLQHDVFGPGRMTLTYGGSTYSGDFETTRSHRIHGRYRPRLGWVADAELGSKSDAKLSCHLEWPFAGKPSGLCKDPSGKDFAVKFQ